VGARSREVAYSAEPAKVEVELGVRDRNRQPPPNSDENHALPFKRIELPPGASIDRNRVSSSRRAGHVRDKAYEPVRRHQVCDAQPLTLGRPTPATRDLADGHERVRRSRRPVFGPAMAAGAVEIWHAAKVATRRVADHLRRRWV
jgi:hypothetical protein